MVLPDKALFSVKIADIFLLQKALLEEGAIFLSVNNVKTGTDWQ